MSAPSSAAGARPRDPAASMSLITELMRHPLDPAYELVSRQRVAQGKPAATGLRTPLLIVTAVLVGLALAASTLTLRAPLGEAQQTHKALVNQINARQKTIDTDSKAITTLQADISARQAAALNRGHQENLTQQLTQLETVTGTGAATGPGLVLTVNDAKDAASANADGDPRTGDSGQGRLTSSDLQVIVNGIWRAGAEAVSINGQRITSQTAIRFAGEAILVNFRALQPPYEITAIGPGDTMSHQFQSGPGGSYLQGLVKGFGIQEHLTTDKSVSVPAAASTTLQHVTVPKETP